MTITNKEKLNWNRRNFWVQFFVAIGTIAMAVVTGIALIYNWHNNNTINRPYISSAVVFIDKESKSKVEINFNNTGKTQAKSLSYRILDANDNEIVNSYHEIGFINPNQNIIREQVLSQDQSNLKRFKLGKLSLQFRYDYQKKHECYKLSFEMLIDKNIPLINKDAGEIKTRKHGIDLCNW